MRPARFLTRYPLALLLTCLLLPGVAGGQTTQPPDRAAAASPPAAEAAAEADDPRYSDRRIRGRVGWASDALQTLYGIKTVSESRERVLALVTEDGRVLPLLEDVRGRAFRRDPRLRDTELELLVRQHSRHPLLQVLRVFEVRGARRQELVYWCEICAITMFELKACDCCQGPIELQRRDAK